MIDPSVNLVICRPTCCKAIGSPYGPFVLNIIFVSTVVFRSVTLYFDFPTFFNGADSVSRHVCVGALTRESSFSAFIRAIPACVRIQSIEGPESTLFQAQFRSHMSRHSSQKALASDAPVMARRNRHIFPGAANVPLALGG